jgi:carbon-monoxide dehydrogenase small subunit
MKPVSFTINGMPVSAEVEPRTHLADFLREQRDLTGTHLGCEHGVCGACTILLDGAPVRSCITYAVACSGAAVTTIEGLDDDEVTAELRDAFKREHALQCGYCTSGMLISARDLVLRAPEADERAIRVAMSGNLCRCTGYVGIIRAVKSVIAARRARSIAPVTVNGGTLGPAGSRHKGSETVSEAVAVNRTATSPASASAQRPPLDRDWKPQVSFEQNFVVHYPRQQVWEFFGRVRDVAACLPGASLVEEPTDNHAEGKMRVKIGPITAEFRGEADIERDEKAYSGTIIGAGSDVRSSSSTRGMINYSLRPANGGRATEVAITVGYTLTGMLAQFGRSGIVQDVASRLTAAFVQNLEARLGGKAVEDLPVSGDGLNAGSLLFALIRDRIRALLKRLFGTR